MNSRLESQRETLRHLLIAYPDGLTNKRWSLRGLMANPSLDEDMIRYFWKKMKQLKPIDRMICKRGLASNPALTPKLMRRYWKSLSEYNDELSGNPSISPELIERHWDMWRGGEYSRRMENISRNPGLNVELMVKHWDELEIWGLENNPSINRAAIEEYCNKLSPDSDITPKRVMKYWNYVVESRGQEEPIPTYDGYRSEYSTLTKDDIIKQWGQLDKSKLSDHPELTYDMVLANPDENWDPYKLSKKIWNPLTGMTTKSARNK